MNQNKFSDSLHIGIIILAAGASCRMGEPKQLLQIGNQTLIERTIDLTKPIQNQATVVVLGANAEKIIPNIKQSDSIKILINEDWQLGMGTTLSKGINYFLSQAENLKAILVMVCDQPYLTTSILENLINTFEQTQAAIVATKYDEIFGVPALFSKALFPQLLQLKKDEGARKIIKNYKGEIASVNFPKGYIDLDTPAAYQSFLKSFKNIN